MPRVLILRIGTLLWAGEVFFGAPRSSPPIYAFTPKVRFMNRGTQGLNLIMALEEQRD